MTEPEYARARDQLLKALDHAIVVLGTNETLEITQREIALWLQANEK